MRPTRLERPSKPKPAPNAGGLGVRRAFLDRQLGACLVRSPRPTRALCPPPRATTPASAAWCAMAVGRAKRVVFKAICCLKRRCVSVNLRVCGHAADWMWNRGLCAVQEERREASTGIGDMAITTSSHAELIGTLTLTLTHIPPTQPLHSLTHSFIHSLTHSQHRLPLWTPPQLARGKACNSSQ